MNDYSNYTSNELFLQLANTSTKQTRHIKHKKHRVLWGFLVELTNFLPINASAVQRIWHIHNNSTIIPLCRTCNVVECEWSIKNQRYNYHCSNRCRAIDPEVNNKRSQTCVDRYGEDKQFTNPQHLASTRTTCLANNGVLYPLQNTKIRNHTIETLIRKYGTNAMDVIRQQGQSALKVKYGHVSFGSMFASNHFQQKRRNSVITNWLPERLQSISQNVTPLFAIDQYVDSQTPMDWQCIKCGTTFADTLMNGRTPRCPSCFPLNRTFWKQRELTEFVRALDPNVVESTRSVIGPKELDIYSHEHRIAIEYNGLYWHSDAVNQDAEHYHLNKSRECSNANIKLLHIFEDDWKSKRPIIESILRNAFGKIENKIAARQCSIVQLSYKDSSVFLNENHLQGEDRAPIRYGLMHNERLVYVMTFGKPRFDKSYQYELYRAAPLINTTVMGGANKLFAHFVRTHNPRSVVTYADKTLFSGNVYTRMGFESQQDTPPAYSYVSVPEGCTSRQSRFKFQKHKLSKILPVFDDELTEEQNMKNNGYYKIWNCGNHKFAWNDTIK